MKIKKRGLCAGLVIFGLIITLASCAAGRTHFMDSLKSTHFKDGVYVGSNMNPIPPCNVKLSTTVKDGKITDIKILGHFVSYPFAGRAYTIVPKRIVEKQSLDVDAVTGATVSTDNIKKAALDSLKKAQTD